MNPKPPQEGDDEGSAQIHAAFCHAGLANRPRLLAPGDTVTLAEPHWRRRSARLPDLL